MSANPIRSYVADRWAPKWDCDYCGKGMAENERLFEMEDGSCCTNCLLKLAERNDFAAEAKEAVAS